MAFIRTNKKENPFVMVDKTCIEDSNLKWQSKGLLTYLLSRPDDWTINQKDLVNRSSDGKAAVSTALLDLMEHGYCYYYPLRNQDGTIKEWVYEVYESPEDNPNLEESIKIAKEKINNKKAKNKEWNKKKKENDPESSNRNQDSFHPESSNRNQDEFDPESSNRNQGNPDQDNQEQGNQDNTNIDSTNIDSINIEEEEEEEEILETLNVSKESSDICINAGMDLESIVTMFKHAKERKYNLTDFNEQDLSDAISKLKADMNKNNPPIHDPAKWLAGSLDKILKTKKYKTTKKPTNHSQSNRKKSTPSSTRTDSVPSWISNPSIPSDHMSEEEKQNKKTALKQLLSKYKKEEQTING